MNKLDLLVHALCFHLLDRLTTYDGGAYSIGDVLGRESEIGKSGTRLSPGVHSQHGDR